MQVRLAMPQAVARRHSFFPVPQLPNPQLRPARHLVFFFA